MSDTRSRTEAPTRLRVTRLDGLRGFAVLSVVVYHAETHLGLGRRPGGGFVGVAVFFVLSGYLITHLVWLSHDGAGLSGYWAFLRRRFTRLAPALVAFVVIWALVVFVLGGESIGGVLRSGALAVTQTTAYFLAVGGQGNPGWGPTWSLSVEWCFYLLWPLVILLLRRRGVSALTASRVAIGLGLILYVAALPLNDTQFYFLPLANVSVALWGGALALRHIRWSEAVDGNSAGRDRAVVFLGIALLVALAAAPGDQGVGYRWLFLPVAVVGALIVVDGRPGAGGWGNRFLELRLLRAVGLRAVGLRAYSIYLWHVPVMWLLYQELPHRSGYVVAVLSLLVSVPVVLASFELFERPALGGRGRENAKLGPDQVGRSPGVTRPVTDLTWYSSDDIPG
jgi:peptidoglycan/LPS O-acetylase OafA/YrhL